MKKTDEGVVETISTEAASDAVIEMTRALEACKAELEGLKARYGKLFALYANLLDQYLGHQE